MKILLSLHRAAVAVYLALCPLPPGNGYLYGAFGVPAPTPTLRDRFGQLLAFAVLGLPLMAVFTFMTGALPDYGRILATAYLGAVLWFLASVDVAAKKQAVADLRAFDRERL